MLSYALTNYNTTVKLIPNINNKNVEAIAFPVFLSRFVFPLSHSLKCIHNHAKTFFHV